ncbi:MAG: hypothetical protein KJI71_05675, partial [Patescibacteria group bacterium]|nr:hypothetical protein [Patescibacteria group bacterium]
PLKSGYVKSQLFSSYRRKPILPPNYDKDYYKGIGVAPTEEEIRYKNPLNYMIKKSLQEKRQKKPRKENAPKRSRVKEIKKNK